MHRQINHQEGQASHMIAVFRVVETPDVEANQGRAKNRRGITLSTEARFVIMIR